MVVVVPLAKRVGLGSVIGYLVAGALLGPSGFGLIEKFGMGSPEQTAALAEFGVIMMLLLIGLELNPSLLLKMRGPIFGLGGLQVVSTTILFTLGARGFGIAWTAAIAIGLIASASSTAVVMQTLRERGYAKSVGGERTFAVLLFQDLAVIPMLAILPLLGGQPADDGHGASGGTKALLVFGAVAAVVGVGRFMIRPLFKVIARTKLRETFTALALLIVVGSAALMHAVGLSPALGAFLAGVVLADSEFRHQIEADIEPFKGLLLGLFFITVGSNIQLSLLVSQPGAVAATVFGIVVGKAILVYAIGRLSRMPPPESLLFGVSLAQGGEFAFVLLAQTTGLLPPETAQILSASIALSMALAPLLIGLAITHGMSRLECVTKEVRAPDVVDESERMNPVLIVGVGRFGQTMIRFLRANGIRSTVLDLDSEQIEIMARFGIKSYFGDGANLDLLRAAGIENARALVLAIDEAETAIRIVEEMKVAYPGLPIFSRAYDRLHAYRLLHLGVKEVAIETSGSALVLGTEVLKLLGMSSAQAERNAAIFQERNNNSVRELAKRFHEVDRETFIQASAQSSAQLEALFASDPAQIGQSTPAWTEPSAPNS